MRVSFCCFNKRDSCDLNWWWVMMTRPADYRFAFSKTSQTLNIFFFSVSENHFPSLCIIFLSFPSCFLSFFTVFSFESYMLSNSNDDVSFLSPYLLISQKREEIHWGSESRKRGEDHLEEDPNLFPLSTAWTITI